MATLRVAAKTEAAPMMAAQIAKPGADFEIVEREIPKPGPGQVRIKVQACGVCHSDMLTKEGACPAFSIPAFPDTKSWASSTNWVMEFPTGKRDNVSVSAGMAAMTTRAASVGAEIFAIART